MRTGDLAAAYSTLSTVLANGPGPRGFALLRASPTLDRALDEYSEMERVEVDHEHAFGFNVPLVAGAFLDAGRRAGGPTGDRIRAAYADLGFVPSPAGPGPEHLSTVLAAMGAGRVDARFIDGQVLSWLPLVATAVRRLGRSYPTALVEQIEDLVLLHRAMLVEPCAAHHALPPADLALDDPETDLRAIAEWLATPARCGVYLARADLARIGGGNRVPRGFGDRSQLLVNLLRSAGHFDAIDGVFGDLEGVVDDWGGALAEPRYAGVSEVLAPWVGRIAETRAMLGTLRARVARVA